MLTDIDDFVQPYSLKKWCKKSYLLSNGYIIWATKLLLNSGHQQLSSGGNLTLYFLKT